MTERAHRLAETLMERIEGVEIEFHEAYWGSQVEATPENDARRVELEMKLREIKGDPEAYGQIEEALRQGIHDPVLKRRLEVLRLSFLGNQATDEERREMVELSSAIESDFASYRADVDGTRLDDNQILEALETSNDTDHRLKVWQGSKQVGSLVADRVRELARVRNAVAHRLGFADYYRMELDLQELDEDWLFGTLADVERLTDEPFRIWKEKLDSDLRSRFGVDEIYPWHYADPFFQELPPEGAIVIDHLFEDKDPAALALQTFDLLGIDLRSVMSKSDLYPREKKCQHAFCIDVDRRGDVRILANVRPNERWTETMLHESGHAAYDVTIDHRLPYTLRRVTHTFVTEAIAQLFGRMVRDPRWLTMVPAFPESEIAPMEEDLRQSLQAQITLFARWVLVMAHFERDLYADPEGDLDARWWDYVERFQLVTKPGDKAPEGAWASKIHVACAPVYYHNYLLGDLLAFQLRAVCRDRFGGLLGSTEAGELLKQEVFKPGNSLRWDEVIERATGKPLTADEFAAALAS